MKKLLAAVLFVLPVLASADGPAATDVPMVTVAARGNDARQVLTEIFLQAKKSCVIQRNIHSELYLTLEKTPFDQALQIVCKQADLTFDTQDGVYYFYSSQTRAATSQVARISKPKAEAVVLQPKTIAPPAAPVGRLSASVLNRRVNTRLAKAPIRSVLEAFGKQAGVTIEVDPQVPAYKLDAFLLNTSLRYALDQVTRAANLIYRFTDHRSILVMQAESKVTLEK
jgi:hypothetical protein